MWVKTEAGCIFDSDSIECITLNDEDEGYKVFISNGITICIDSEEFDTLASVLSPMDLKRKNERKIGFNNVH